MAEETTPVEVQGEPQVGSSDPQPESSAGGGNKSYVLGDDATVSSVSVDDKVVTKHGDPVELTQDQFDRANSVDGVELVEGKENQ